MYLFIRFDSAGYSDVILEIKTETIRWKFLLFLSVYWIRSLTFHPNPKCHKMVSEDINSSYVFLLDLCVRNLIWIYLSCIISDCFFHVGSIWGYPILFWGPSINLEYIICFHAFIRQTQNTIFPFIFNELVLWFTLNLDLILSSIR